MGKARESKFEFMHALSESKSIFEIEQKAIVSCFVKNAAFSLGHPVYHVLNVLHVLHVFHVLHILHVMMYFMYSNQRKVWVLVNYFWLIIVIGQLYVKNIFLKILEGFVFIPETFFWVWKWWSGFSCQTFQKKCAQYPQLCSQRFLLAHSTAE